MVTIAILAVPAVFLTLAATCACLSGSRCECPLLTRSEYDDETVGQVIQKLEIAA
ncbi:MAG TPA: hypothetical protein QGH10_18720 [Armatimonadota bacterium]|jgi:hypothetical protein|nr:hypothetical protein [Armatimonadota bacterium]